MDGPRTRGIPNSGPAANLLGRMGFPAAVPILSPVPTLHALAGDLERRRLDAERVCATAPVGAVLAAVLEDLRPLLAAAPASTPLPVLPSASVTELLSPPEAARRLGVTVRWLYSHADGLPFVRRLSRRALRFDAVGLTRWVASQR